MSFAPETLLAWMRPAPLPPEVERRFDAEVRDASLTTTRVRLVLAVMGIVAAIGNLGANTVENSAFTILTVVVYAVVASAFLYALRGGRHGRWVPWGTATLDALFVAALSWVSLTNHAGAYETLLAPAFPILSLLSLTLTALHYNVMVSLWAALLASGLRLATLLWLAGTHRVVVSDTAVYGERAIGMADQVTIVFFLLLAGLVAAWVARTSRVLVLRGVQEAVRTQALERAQEQYRRYMSGPVLDYVLSNPEAMGLGGRRRSATVMFVDIRNFTAYSEAEAPERVVEFLNTCFREFVDVVFAHGGTLDKFLGDGLMAVFGVPREMEDTPGRALQAAVDMLARVDALNAARPPGAHELRIGIGIAHGVVIAGNIGSEARMEFTVIGDTVNFAARLQELNKDLNTVIVVSEAVHDAVKGRFALRRLPPVRVRGKSGEVAVWGMGAEPRAPAQRPFEVRVRAGAPGVETA